MSNKKSNGLSQEMIGYLDARMGGLRYEAPPAETNTTVYMGAQHQPAETKFDETSGQILVNVDGHGWVPMTSSIGGPPISGDLRVDGSAGLNWSGARIVAEPGPGYLQAMSTLNKLVNAVEAGACCRCAPTEVCPECHDLNLALDSAKKTLEAFSQPAYARHESKGAARSPWNPCVEVVPQTTDSTVTLQSSYTGTTVVPANTFTVARSSDYANLSTKAGT